MENHFNCIYLYTNKVNGKKYVGQAKDFNNRHSKHISGAYCENTKYDYNVPFHNAIRKYNINNFKVEILKENLKDYEEMNYWECYYINEFDTLAKNGKGYNVASGGHNGNNFAGKTEEEMKEIRKKMSEAYQNKTEEEKAEIGKRLSEKSKQWWKNATEEKKEERNKKWHETMNNKSEEEKAEISKKRSEAYQNKTEEEKAEIERKRFESWNNRSDEEKVETTKKRLETYYNKTDEEKAEMHRKRSEATKGENNPMYGKKHSEETRKKQSDNMKGKFVGENNPNWGKHHSEETLKKLRKPKTEEHKRKLSEAKNNKSDEEKAEIIKKFKETMNNKSEEEKAEISKKRSEAYQNKTEEEKAKIGRKISEAYQNKTEEEKAKIGRKISEIRKEKGLVKGSSNPKARKVIQLDPFTKQPVFIWQYKKQATEFYNFSHTLLDAYLKGKRKTGHEYNGFLWYYLDEWEQLTK